MRRREFIELISGAALAWPLAAHAQQNDKIARVAFLGPSRTSPAQIGYYTAFFSQLEKHGLREGQNVVVEFRAVDDPRGPFVGAAELMRTQSDLIVVVGPEVGLQAVVGASSHTPVVMLAGNFDPIERGYVASLAQPGGNITGVVVRPIELARKQIDLLKQTFPDRDRLAMLYDAQTVDQFTAAEQTARSLNLQVQALKLEIPSYDFVGAFRTAAEAKAQIVMVLSSPGFQAHSLQLAELAIKHRLPTMFTFKHYVDAGGLMSYGVDLTSTWRRTADYVARILKGAKPAELPIEQASKFEFVVNLKTAKVLGVTIPNGILLAADEVIE
jgi:ABC-type uncharacterized transport system substrate-binding protein